MSGGDVPDSTRTRVPYFGSVLFFKHVILAVVVLLVLIPSVSALLLWSHNGELQQQLCMIKTAFCTAQQQARVLSAQPLLADSSAVARAALCKNESPDYTQLYPELYANPTHVGSVDLEKSVYLTFDDGPSEETEKILAVLEQYGIKATFFVVGTTDQAGMERMRAITEAGHTLGIHSYTHDYKTIYSSVEAYLADFNEMYCQIVEATGIAPQIFRFPGGSINSYNGNVYFEIIAEMTRRGFVYFDWNATNGDAASTVPLNAKVLAANALKGTEARRAIVLMHDSATKTTTVEALPAIIEGYRDAGFSFYPLTPQTRSITFGYQG